jgi:GT2 family glycosyltransferase
VAVVSVNYNTVELVSYLVFSLYRIVGRAHFDRITIVDNGSGDGSVELLRTLAGHGLIDVVLNRRQRYHGPALNQALSSLARTWRPDGPPYVWVLDSDTVVLRPEALTDAVALGQRHRAAILGDYQGQDDDQPTLRSLLIDPTQVWRRPFPPFEEHGLPSESLVRKVLRRRLQILRFPYFASGYVLHLGSGTLNGLVQRGETTNRYFDWATSWAWAYETAWEHDRNEPRFRRFVELFREEVPVLSGAALAEACARPALLRIDPEA